jgi:DNA-binding NarL/FixJ family response regulator
MSEAIRLLVVDDHAIVREGLCAMLEMKKGIRVIGEAGDGVEAVERALELNPDVILMDLVMPRKNGISATHDIMERQPEARILVLSSFSEDAQIAESIRAGAKGYLLKSAKGDELVKAIRQVYAGEAPLNPLVARRMITAFVPRKDEPRLADVLTERELMVLPLVARGLKNREIGQQLGITERTVGTHIGNMIRKAGVENRVQLVNMAGRQGLTSLYSDD